MKQNLVKVAVMYFIFLFITIPMPEELTRPPLKFVPHLYIYRIDFPDNSR